jgi:hypothetical protein
LRNEYFKEDYKASFLIVCGGPKNAINLDKSNYFFDNNGILLIQINQNSNILLRQVTII